MKNKPSMIVHPRPVYPYLVWMICNLINLYAFLLQFSSWDVRSHFHEKGLLFTADKGVLFTPFVLAVIIFQIPVALFIDKFGPRKVSSLTLVIASAGVMLFGYTHSHTLLWIGVFLMGLGATITYVNTFKLIANWFSHSRFPFLVSWTIIAIIISSIIGQPLIILLAKQFGWTNLLMNLGMLGIVLALIFFFFVRDQHESALSQFDFGPSLKKVFSSPNTYLIALAGAGITPWIASVGFWHHAYYTVAYEMSGGDAAFINLIDMLGFGIGALFFSIYGKRVGKRKVLIGGGVLASLLVTCLLFFAPRFSLPSVVLLTGLGSFFIGSVTLTFTLICENNHFKSVGLSVGILCFTVALLRFIENLLISLIITGKSKVPVETLLESSTKEFQQGLILMPVFLLLSFICVIFIKENYEQ
ncbi:MFS transporter [Simkania sp.]|uniref:MFS transporter n=1 Tax=Simkania sp. TaxID=34094 RepID=UPI003B521A7D